MKKNNKLAILVGIIAIAIILVVSIIIINYPDATFSIKEKQWMEDNKNEVIDISILNNIPVLNYNGQGLLFSFLDDFEQELGLKFNKSAYKLDDNVENKYVFQLVDKKSDHDLLIYRDNYVLIANDNTVYNNLDSINNLKLGILNKDVNNFKKYLNSSNEFVGYDSISEMINDINDKDKIDGIIILKTLIMEDLVKNDLTISYQFVNYTNDYVITLNGNPILNSIINKYYNKWEKKDYDNIFYKYLLEHYYSFKGIGDSEQTNVKSKKYTYGFVDNGIYDLLQGSNFKGINKLILKSFSNFSGISVAYKKYNSINDLITDYNQNKIDLFLNNTSYNQFNHDSIITKSAIESKLVAVSKNSNNIVVDSLYSLQNKKIVIVANSNIENYLDYYDINYQKYKNLKEMFKKTENDSILILDLDNYIFYKNSDLADYKIDYIFNIDNSYNYVLNSQDKVFASLFDFYINYMSIKQIISDGYEGISYKVVNYFYILIIVIVLFAVMLSLLVVNKTKKMITEIKNKRKVNLSKTDKLKYIDQLTSLKNRAYLNSKIDEWDNSEIYPQAIIIIDLNNIAYINDNYGREEGDKVIVEAASILINSQLPNSEIIRTDGNEFLIYLVGYTEKNTISYLRSLSRSFKRLTHGFGAASGYSIITDGIKTIDDAVNEATIDMKNNKEDIDY